MFRNPITCPTAESDLKDAVEFNCWMSGGYANKSEMSGKCKEEAMKANANHQWIVVLMAVQAMMFFAPWLTLKALEDWLEMDELFGRHRNVFRSRKIISNIFLEVTENCPLAKKELTLFMTVENMKRVLAPFGCEFLAFIVLVRFTSFR